MRDVTYGRLGSYAKCRLGAYAKSATNNLPALRWATALHHQGQIKPPPPPAMNLDGSLVLSCAAYQSTIVAAEFVRLICRARRPRTNRLALGRQLTTFSSPGLLKLRQLLATVPGVRLPGTTPAPTDSPRNTGIGRRSPLYVSAPAACNYARRAAAWNHASSYGPLETLGLGGVALSMFLRQSPLVARPLAAKPLHVHDISPISTPKPAPACARRRYSARRRQQHSCEVCFPLR